MPFPGSISRAATCLLAALLLSSSLARATHQEGDRLVFRGELFQIPVFPLELSPLPGAGHTFTRTPGASDTGNLRGYVASWEIEDDTLWLVEIDGYHCAAGGPCRRASLDALFPGRLEYGRVRATWFTGVLVSPGFCWGRSPDPAQIRQLLEKATLVIRVRDGCVLEVEDSRSLDDPPASR